MPKNPKWYMLALRGSLTCLNNFANRKISNDRHEVNQFDIAKESPRDTDAPREPLRQMKAEQTTQKNDNAHKALIQSDQSQLKHSGKLEEFARELRYRELKRYYANLIESERSITKIIHRSTCPDCGLLKPQINRKDISKNIYCWGPTTLCQGKSQTT
ncbi:uncharacterized protein LOC111600723 [Drosophila hydei]|uniref:Uncharacterized protein LOC111600723 n=1 Tax=Drosophila hydei TaxID=7224 RepID=A0A6J1LZB0_DROHY|nr:uncharacterized protein LOC111600723 [Drosophila hydei]